MKSYWLSWWSTESMGAFELNSPWWISGSRIGGDGECDDASICAAIQANNEDGVLKTVIAAYDTKPAVVEWRFIEEQPVDWSPFCDRFPKADWMEWPVHKADTDD